MAEEAIWNTANLHESMAFVEADCCRILRIDAKLKLNNPVSECVLCHLAQEVRGNPSPAFALPDVDAD